MSQYQCQATMDNYASIMNFIETSINKTGFCSRQINHVMLAAEEAVTNIIKYAYPGRPGSLQIFCRESKEKKGLILELIDRGIPFDPLDKEPPDINQSIEQRKIGGLGIHLILNVMDEVHYKRENDCNILILVKYV